MTAGSEVYLREEGKSEERDVPRGGPREGKRWGLWGGTAVIFAGNWNIRRSTELETELTRPWWPCLWSTLCEPWDARTYQLLTWRSLEDLRGGQGFALKWILMTCIPLCHGATVYVRLDSSFGHYPRQAATTRKWGHAVQALWKPKPSVSRGPVIPWMN